MNTDKLSNENENPILRIGAVSCCRFIFLDIDGVIATPKTVEHGMWALTPEKQELLGMIIEKTGAKIVLSSSWRKHTSDFRERYSDPYFNVMGSVLKILYSKVLNQPQKMTWFNPVKSKPTFHAYATMVIEKEGVFPAKELLGHESLNSTLFYNHIPKSKLIAMYNPLDDVAV